MRHGGTSSRNLQLLPFALFIALLLPTGALAGVKQDAADPTVRLPATSFGLGHAAASSVNVSLDDSGKDGKDKEDKDKKCKEKKDDCDAPASDAAPTSPPAPADEPPEASWSGLPVLIDA